MMWLLRCPPKEKECLNALKTALMLLSFWLNNMIHSAKMMLQILKIAEHRRWFYTIYE